jgi:hypothetical protein
MGWANFLKKYLVTLLQSFLDAERRDAERPRVTARDAVYGEAVGPCDEAPPGTDFLKLCTFRLESLRTNYI